MVTPWFWMATYGALAVVYFRLWQRGCRHCGCRQGPGAALTGTGRAGAASAGREVGIVERCAAGAAVGVAEGGGGEVRGRFRSGAVGDCGFREGDLDEVASRQAHCIGFRFVWTIASPLMRKYM